MKRILIVTAAAVLAGLIVLVWGWRAWTGGTETTGEPVRVRIAAGMNLRAATDTLQARGLLDHPRMFLWGARLTGRDRDLKAGLFEVRPGLAPRDLLALLTAGQTVQIRITLPEGRDAEETAAVLAESLGFSAESFLSAADSLAVVIWGPGTLPAAGWDELPRTFRASEGLLAPDTYLFGEGTGPVEAAEHLVRTQRARVDSVLARKRPAATAGLGPLELVTLASIIEAEARRADERRRIAAVYVNRLAAGRRLEADPTVAYILRKKGKRLFYRDLETDSPYNTYRRAGLPPGPIANPGRDALEAAARPDTTSEDYFFVSDGEGGHVFSRTAAEHEAAVREFRRKRADQVRER